MNLKLYVLLLVGMFFLNIPSQAQNEEDFPSETFALDNMDAFQPTAANWKIVGKVEASMNEKHKISTSQGTGILVNAPDKDNKAQLFSKLEHGDLDLAFEFMMPKGSNSGIYLQGRYEIQLFDSWGKKRPAFSDLGGIYQRWDATKPKGQEGFEGTAPSLNVAKAPGLWQSMRISFQAPRFDANGNKIQNARIIFVELNGVRIHRDIELTGPTRGPYVKGEGPHGPLVIQGDHGPVAFRNFTYRSFSGQPVTVKDLSYKVVRQARAEFEDWNKVTIDAEGQEDQITWEVVKTANNFSLLYNGTLEVPKTGKYRFRLTSGGQARLSLKGEEVFPPNWGLYTKTLMLDAGLHPFELEYTKAAPWIQGQLGLEVAGKDFRMLALNAPSSNITSAPVDPIYIKSEVEARHLRSFVDFKTPEMESSKRITNAINIGDPTQLHYSYDLNQGSLVQIWRGDFLNTTPMWHNRGNGVSVPMGAVLQLTPVPQVMQVQSDKSLSSSFAKGSYQYKAYRVDENNRPTFQYMAYGLEVNDQILPKINRQGLQRQLQFSGTPNGKVLYCLAEAASVGKADKGIYVIGDAAYFIKTNASVKIQDLPDGRQALVFNIDGNTDLNYEIIW